MPPPPERIRVATWNCFGAPQVADDFFEGRCFWPERLESRALAATLARYDVLCVQENLVEGVRERLEQLQRAAGFAELWFDPMGPDHLDGTFVGGGLAILSRFPLEARFIRLARGAGPDGFARKGFAVATVQLPSRRIVNIVNTHLQADDPRVPAEACRAARAAQLAGLAEALQALREGNARTIVCGDLNVEHGTDEYAAMRRTLGEDLEDLAARAELTSYDIERNDLARAFHPGVGATRALYDYILTSPEHFAPGTAYTLLDAPLPDVQSRPSGDDVRPFSSDHFGVGVTLRILR